MDKGPRDAFDGIRKHLQLILLHAEMCQKSGECEACAESVCDIVTEIRTLEAYIQEAEKKFPHE